MLPEQQRGADRELAHGLGGEQPREACEDTPRGTHKKIRDNVLFGISVANKPI
jgi:hypothetical protein